MANLESKLISDNTHLWATWDPNSQTQSIVDRLNSGKPVRIIGPCAAQSKEQVLSILEVTAENSDAIRLPDKKPRTRPVKPDGTTQFLGIGHEEISSIYKAIAERYPRFAIGAETMTKADIRRLVATGLLSFSWTGSRIQEQESLQKLGQGAKITNTLMMIKNPLTSDHEMYLGMMENWIIGAKYSVPLIACIRGEAPNVSDNQEWRNKPNFDLIDELVQSFPGLPIIIDPSHMVKDPKGDEDLKNKRLITVVDLISEGLDRGVKGYMVEVNHPKHKSLTDPGENVYDLMNLLVRRGLA